ncbi:hypothetical protein KUM39_07160 [Streptomyces sp. J2-1]|uniref:hypothetical protein n=1 Tax=Streptomyces corallincola TaxID=2851888 RepID=UPI001C38E975|nr:hypothetical protein [Streptomyces corallincola]MBV2354144.1 hypothetical protein [Streptomyces corallincola]
MIEKQQPVVVYPPAEDGGRRVRVGDDFVGMAYTPLDVADFLRRTGMGDIAPEDVAQADWVHWQGGGPEVWEH